MGTETIQGNAAKVVSTESQFPDERKDLEIKVKEAKLSPAVKSSNATPISSKKSITSRKSEEVGPA